MAAGFDVDYPRLLLVVVLCCVLVGLFWGLSTSTAAFGPYNYGWDGGSDLRTGLGSQGTDVDVALSTAAYDDSEPGGTVAVVIDPAERYSEREQARLSLFVSQGGTLVVASATNRTNELLAGLGATPRIDGRQVRDEQRNYRSPALPVAPDVANHSRVRGVDALTLNRGTVLDPGDATPLVNTSIVSSLDANANGAADENGTLGSRPVAAVEAVGNGAVIVLSDGSIFTNAMLDRSGNRQFLRNLAADHDRALLDHSHRGPLPPLSYAVLVVRTTPVVQFLLGVAGLSGVALCYYGLPLARMRDRRSERAAAVQVDEATIAASLSDRHPEWEPQRVQRVTKVIRQQRQQEGDNE